MRLVEPPRETSSGVAAAPPKAIEPPGVELLVPEKKTRRKNGALPAPSKALVIRGASSPELGAPASGAGGWRTPRVLPFAPARISGTGGDENRGRPSSGTSGLTSGRFSTSSTQGAHTIVTVSRPTSTRLRRESPVLGRKTPDRIESYHLPHVCPMSP